MRSSFSTFCWFVSDVGYKTPVSRCSRSWLLGWRACLGDPWPWRSEDVVRMRFVMYLLGSAFLSVPMLQLARSRHQKENNPLQTKYIQVNEEFLPFRNNSINIVFSPLFLHWTNDILRCFREVYRVLIPDGYFTGVMFSSKTLHELRDVMETAEMRTENVMSPHVSPLPTPGSIGDALVVEAVGRVKGRRRDSSSRT